MDALVQDFKAAARSLRARKGFVALAVGTLALALGANSSVFGVIHAVLLEQLPYRDAERLAILWNVKADGENEVLSVANFEDYQAGARALERIAAWFEQGVNLTGEGEPERLFASRVSAGFFEVLGAAPALGRTFGVADHGGGGAHVVVLGDALWRRRFGGDPAVIGRTLRLGDDSYEVVGVMAPGFFFPGARADLALPLDLATEPRRARRDDGFLRVVARLVPGVTRTQAERQMSGDRPRSPGALPRDQQPADGRLACRRSPTSWWAPSVRSCALLQAAVGLVVLIACLNLAMLLLGVGEREEPGDGGEVCPRRGARPARPPALPGEPGPRHRRRAGGDPGRRPGHPGAGGAEPLPGAASRRCALRFGLPGVHLRRRRAHHPGLRPRTGAVGLHQLAAASAGRRAFLRRSERGGRPPGAGGGRGGALAHPADRGRPDGAQLRPPPPVSTRASVRAGRSASG